MKEIKVSIIEAFAKQVKMGNPAGVIFDADSLSESQMQNIAKIVGFNESVFILKSAVADMKLRYFTPNHEMNLCGHATIASISEFMKKNNKGFVADCIHYRFGAVSADFQYFLLQQRRNAVYKAHGVK